MFRPPDIDDSVEVLASFVLEDLIEALSSITQEIKDRRKRPHHKASHIKPFKEARARLHRFLEPARSNSLTEQELADATVEIRLAAALGACK